MKETSVNRMGWLFATRGVLALLFGFLLLLHPGFKALTLVALVSLFGVYALADGLTGLFAAFRKEDGAKEKGGKDKGEHGRFWEILDGGVSIAAGLLVLLLPVLSTAVIYGFIALWALTSGLVKFGLALQSAHERRLGLVVQGLLTALFGVFMLALPPSQVIGTAAKFIASFALAAGVVWLVLAVARRAESSHRRRAFSH